MTTTILAQTDGKVFVPDEPAILPVDTPLRVRMGAVNDHAPITSPAEDAMVTPAPRTWQHLSIQIDPALSNAIALDPEFNIEES